MANVKRLKRVIVEGEALKEFNAGDKKPAFRQNGYELTLDSVNKDHLTLSKAVVIGDDIQFKFVLNSTAIDQYFFSDVNRTCRIVMTTNYFSAGLSDIVVTANGVVVPKANGMWDDKLGQTIEVTCKPSINTDITAVGNQPNSNNPLSATLLDFSIATENFIFEESRGTTTTGSEGTIATINTSNAGGVQYLDSTVWNKKSFALELDRANFEYIQLSKSVIIGDEIRLKFVLNSTSIDQYFFSDDDKACRMIITNGIFSVGVSNTVVTANGINVPIASGMWAGRLGQTIEVTCDTTIDTDITFVGNRPELNNPLSATLFPFSIGSETFNLNEGLGNKILGSIGTIGTIYTSNAQGIERTNYGQWLKGSDDIGWYDYNSFTPYLVGTSSLVGSSIIS